MSTLDMYIGSSLVSPSIMTLLQTSNGISRGRYPNTTMKGSLEAGRVEDENIQVICGEEEVEGDGKGI